MIALDIPWPPSANHFMGQRNGKRFLSASTKLFREKVSDIVSELNLDTTTQALEVFIALYPPDKRKRDIDNYIKQTFDALQHAGVFEDDSQVYHLDVIKHSPVKGGKCKVVILESEEINGLVAA